VGRKKKTSQPLKGEKPDCLDPSDSEAEDGSKEILEPEVIEGSIEGSGIKDGKGSYKSASDTGLSDTAFADAGAFSEEKSVSKFRKYKPRGSSSKELVPYDPLQRYLAEIKRTRRLSREEEKDLAIRYREQGDLQAAYDLVVANLRLVVMIAREYQKNFKNILDLVQEGNIGLLEAVKKYDPYKGVRFSSYAVYWVRAYMLRYLINNVRLVKVGTTQNQRKLFFNLRKEKAKLEKEGFKPEAKLLAERLDVKESEVIEMEQRLALPDLSVDAPVSGDPDSSDYTLFGKPSINLSLMPMIEN